MRFTMRLGLIVMMMMSALAAHTRVDAQTGPAELGVRVIDFSQGHWDRAAWTPIRMANQAAPVEFVQQPDSIGTTTKTFSEADWAAERDNAILLKDTGADDVQVEVTFRIGKGIHDYSAPGLCIAPQVKDGVLLQSIAIFAADYTMAVWLQQTDGKAVTYRHLVQLARWSDPKKPHLLRCRVSQKEASVAIQLDDEAPIALTFVGNPQLSFIPFKLNPLVGLWACHGACEFQKMRITSPGTLPFIVRTAEVEKLKR